MKFSMIFEAQVEYGTPDVEHETIRKREEFWDRSEEGVQLSEREQEEADKRRQEAEAAGLPPEEYVGNNPVRGQLIEHAKRYPLERMREIEENDAAAKRQAAEEAEAFERHPGYGVLAAVYRDEKAVEAARKLALAQGRSAAEARRLLLRQARATERPRSRGGHRTHQPAGAFGPSRDTAAATA